MDGTAPRVSALVPFTPTGGIWTQPGAARVISQEISPYNAFRKAKIALFSVKKMQKTLLVPSLA
jgi:hypothetical protein